MSNIIAIATMVKQMVATSSDAYEYLADSGWLDELPQERIAALYEQYIDIAKYHIDSMIALYGEPSFHFEDGHFTSWFPEALYGKAWRIDDKVVFVAAEHHELDMPIAVVLGAVSRTQLDKLAI
uniref:hypothetical protein n=1 Tax=Thaumasiovibrio occultus TaxID=1891184 RepID=UPI00131C2DCD|nr:hypothetical protein [Thaumasiovibrio occultus]